MNLYNVNKVIDIPKLLIQWYFWQSFTCVVVLGLKVVIVVGLVVLQGFTFVVVDLIVVVVLLGLAVVVVIAYF